MARPAKPWTISSLKDVVGRDYITLKAFLDGKRYPGPQTLRRIEEHFDWPVRAQIRLIPEEGMDTRYGEAFRKVLDRFYGV
jgi:hypothetical protein